MPRRSQHDRSEHTRTALLDTAHTLFAEHGFAHVSAEQIAAAAGLTRGALYHHYGGKKDLFQAVFERLEAGLAAELAATLAAAPDPGTGLRNAVGAFLAMSQRPDVWRIALTDAPAALGWRAWREIEYRHGLGLLHDHLQTAVSHGLALPAPVPVMAQLLLGTAIEAALMIAASDDPARTRADVEQGLHALLAGLLPTP